MTQQKSNQKKIEKNYLQRKKRMENFIRDFIELMKKHSLTPAEFRSFKNGLYEIPNLLKYSYKNPDKNFSDILWEMGFTT